METVTLLGNNLLEVAQAEDLTPKHLIIYQTDFNINFIKLKKMKKTILISFLLLSCTLFYGQGSSYNLGFSQVINYDYNTTSNVIGYGEVTVGSITVPSNKVWKITSGTAIRDAVGYATHAGIFVNNNMVFGSGVSASVSPVSNTPIWLSTGTYDVKIKNFDSGARTYKGSLSIVEFNIE